MGDERLDVYDDEGRHRGVRDRVAAHAEGWWHRVFHLLIVARRSEGPAAVLQRRATSKRTFPGLLDLSATGHLEAGEGPLDGLRELREELGVELSPDTLVELGVRRIVDETPEGLNRELCHVFVAVDDRPLDRYRPAPAEVASVVEVPIAAGLGLVRGERAEVAGREFDGHVIRPATIRLVDLVPEPASAEFGEHGAIVSRARSEPEPYWTTLLERAARVAAGDRATRF
jgi:isopentenyldiphosphate isomerase